MLEQLKNTVIEHNTRLEVLINHRDLKPALASYIKEFILNDEFKQLVEQIGKEVENG